MSLVGSLEDLGLGDILQIVSLSRKSGLLRLRSGPGEGRIVLHEGLVLGASVKGEAEVRPAGDPRDSSPDGIEALRRTQVERAVIHMFTWRSGEFTFEVGDGIGDADADALLHTGISTQYLAMEASRHRDEAVLASDRSSAEEADEGVVFSGEQGGAAPQPSAVDVLALRTAQEVDVPISVERSPAAPAAIPVAVAREDGGTPPIGAAPRAGAAHLVAIDPDLAGLEWLKSSLEGVFERVHIFQRSEDGVERIRHYLGRGLVPVVVVSTRASADPLAGYRDGEALVRRLRALAPGMTLLALREEGDETGVTLPGVDAVVARPASPGADPEGWGAFQACAARLRDALLAQARGAPAATPLQAARADTSHLARLKQVSARLRDPSSDGEILSLVLDFAAEGFSRAAIFMVRDDRVAGIAQRGMPQSGGPDDGEIVKLGLPLDAQPELFRRALAGRRAVRAPMRGEGDRRLAMLLGTRTPREAYVAPIESGGSVVALLYADNLPDEAPVPDTTALEIVLHEAGLSLDRALLERALADAGRGGA
jgi:hypothetical protein